jgi:Tfp pilus assembly protein PilF
VEWGGHNVLAGNAYRQAKALAPRNLAVRQNYGHFLCEEGHAYNDAITEFSEILKMDPDWNMARPCLYIALFNMNRRNEAAHVLADYRYWNQTHGVPDDSDEIEIDTTIHPNDKKGPSL